MWIKLFLFFHEKKTGHISKYIIPTKIYIYCTVSLDFTWYSLGWCSHCLQSLNLFHTLLRRIRFLLPNSWKQRQQRRAASGQTWPVAALLCSSILQFIRSFPTQLQMHKFSRVRLPAILCVCWRVPDNMTRQHAAGHRPDRLWYCVEGNCPFCTIVWISATVSETKEAPAWSSHTHSHTHANGSAMCLTQGHFVSIQGIWELTWNTHSKLMCFCECACRGYGHWRESGGGACMLAGCFCVCAWGWECSQ